MNDFITFKTSNTAITVVVLPDKNLAKVEEALTEKIATIPIDFFSAQPVAADLSLLAGFTPDISWLQSLKRLFLRHKLVLIGLVGFEMEDQLLAVGLTKITIQEPKTHKPIEKVVERVIEKQITIPAEQCKIIRHPIRSGQQVYAQNTDLIIIGTVSTGAEVYADGNIHIYGALRGRAFAGVKTNNTAAFIYCHEFAAELISIAGFYQDMEQLSQYEGQKNVFISLNENETMKIESFD